MNIQELLEIAKILNSVGVSMEEMIIRDRRAKKISFSLHPDDIAAFLKVAAKHEWQVHTSPNPAGKTDPNVTRWQVRVP